MRGREMHRTVQRTRGIKPRLHLINHHQKEEHGMQKITPFLWLNDQAEEAANLYVSIFKNSKIVKVATACNVHVRLLLESPHGK